MDLQHTTGTCVVLDSRWVRAIDCLGGLGGRGLVEAGPTLLAELFDELPDLLEVVMPLTQGALQPGRDVDHGGFTAEGLPQIERFMPGVVVGGAAAGGLATAARHDDEAAVQEALGLVEDLMEFAAALSLGGGQQRRGNGLAWHRLESYEHTDI